MAELDVSFEFETHMVTGHGGFIVSSGNRYPHVLRLTLSENTPKSLPNHVIVKKEDEELLKTRGEDAENLFDVEMETYQRLKDLQGRYILKLYGVTKVDSSRALILSDIGGFTMIDERMPFIEEDKLRYELRKPLEAIRLCGVLLDDISPNNVHYCDGTFIVFDFEFVEMRYGRTEDMMEEVDIQVDMLVESYKKRQRAIYQARQKHSGMPNSSANKGIFLGWDNYL
ncbi:hypothetical protein BHE90_017045 [Fusarium euwallaceae]|uniref:Protein kinase domain-containing protein n=1 Tax=Fusarium euwallaceae TaxID=1147111 RepID=A0A430KYN9_9HYPO|nr:hypothetical protein BHE90_017045 [Fusarium euwallaceae]